MFVFEKRNSKFECLRIALFLLKYCDCRNADVMSKFIRQYNNALKE